MEQWLITLLDSAGFSNPINVEAQEIIKQLSTGRHKAVKWSYGPHEGVLPNRQYYTTYYYFSSCALQKREHKETRS